MVKCMGKQYEGGTPHAPDLTHARVPVPASGRRCVD